MDNLIGQRFSLISKSEIRYVGTLHEINPEQSTIALEDVFSFGTENRAVASFIPPSPQKFEYIVFRGSDVKDITIEEEAKESKQKTQAPEDPAILNSTRPGSQPASQGQSQNQGPNLNPGPGPVQGHGHGHGPSSAREESPFPPPPNFPPQGYGGYYGPPPPGQFGRGYGPPPGNFGPGPGYAPYGPPPGYFGPPGQGFPPQGPGRFPPQQQHNAAPIGPPGQRPPSHGPQQQQQQQPPQPSQSLQPPQQQQAPNLPLSQPGAAIGQVGQPTSELPVDKVVEKPAHRSTTSTPQPVSTEPTNPTNGSVASAAHIQPPPTVKPSQTQPKPHRVTPAMPFAVNQKSFIPPVPADTPQNANQPPSRPVKTQAEMDEASRQAKEAVANALARLNPQNGPPPTQVAAPTVDHVTERMSQITTGPPSYRSRGNYRGQRGARTASGGPRPKVESKLEIPQSDFDFESSNAKFNKGDMIKEAIASGSPLGETPGDTLGSSGVNSTANGSDGLVRKESLPANLVPSYNKTSSFFDDISSEAKDREEAFDARANGRALRGVEFQKNVETFGQGNVDSGFRGRGRGGYRGQRRGNFARDDNYRGGYRGRGRGQSNGSGQPATAAQF